MLVLGIYMDASRSLLVGRRVYTTSADNWLLRDTHRSDSRAVRCNINGIILVRFDRYSLNMITHKHHVSLTTDSV